MTLNVFLAGAGVSPGSHHEATDTSACSPQVRGECPLAAAPRRLRACSPQVRGGALSRGRSWVEWSWAGYNTKCNTRRERSKKERQYAAVGVKCSCNKTKNTEASILSYHRFTLEERKCIQDLLAERHLMRYIAKILGQRKSTLHFQEQKRVI